MYQVNAEITHYENLFIKTTNILDADCRRELEWYYKKTYDNTKKIKISILICQVSVNVCKIALI